MEGVQSESGQGFPMATHVRRVILWAEQHGNDDEEAFSDAAPGAGANAARMLAEGALRRADGVGQAAVSTHAVWRDLLLPARPNAYPHSLLILQGNTLIPF